MENCELCGGAARMYCEPDQASLCWDCDRKVHGANFLVAKHTRSLLCHACHRPTLWRASGQNLGRAVSACDSCVNVRCKDEERPEEKPGEYGEDENSGDYDDDVEEEEEEVDSDDDEEEGEQDGENQVVPWSKDTLPSPPVVSSDSSSGGEEEVISGIRGGGGCCGSKRMRENLAVYSDDDIDCSSSHIGSGALASGEAASRALKKQRLGELNRSEGNEETESKSTAVISSLKQLQKQMIIDNGDASATVLGICGLSREQSR
ncbi:hypothetical protein SLE2022_394680 [Rubroshorea leprosula]